MTIWIAALASWALAVTFERFLSRRGTAQAPIAVPLRPWFRYSLVGAVIVVAIIAAFVAATALIPFGGRQDPEPLATLGAAAALWGVAAILREFIAGSEILVTNDGIWLFHVFLSWSDVTDLKFDDSRLGITSPRRRSAWNAWTGRADLPLNMWRIPNDVKREIMRLYAARAV